MELSSDIAMLRRVRGWTQQELASHSGLSVRTIRNVELGRVENPRRSSVDLLMRTLGAVEADRSRCGASDGHGWWRGLPPPDSPLLGRGHDVERLARSVASNRLTMLLGPGGVGKTRLALEVAADIRKSFRHGVAVVELGDLPAEITGAACPTAWVLQRAKRLMGQKVAAGAPNSGDHDRDTQLLLVLDNAEHIPVAVATATKELLSSHPFIHIVVTTRRPLTERLGTNRHVRPLEFDADDHQESAHPPAVELMLRHAGAGSPVIVDLTRDIPAVVELCRRLGGIPRALELAAERLRTIPIRSLLASGPALAMLRTSDHALLAHQRSLATSLRWSMDLLTDAHRRLLRQLSALPTIRFTVDDVVAVSGPADLSSAENTRLLSDLVDSSLVDRCGDQLYEYQLAPYVGEVLRTDPDSDHQAVC